VMLHAPTAQQNKKLTMMMAMDMMRVVITSRSASNAARHSNSRPALAITTRFIVRMMTMIWSRLVINGPICTSVRNATFMRDGL